YLVEIAVRREMGRQNTEELDENGNVVLRALDWDGEHTINETAEPDPATLAAHQSYVSKLLGDLRSIADATLPESEKKIRENALYYGRLHATAGNSFGWGADAQVVPYFRPFNIYSPIYETAIDRLYDSDEALLEQADAIWSGSLK